MTKEEVNIAIEIMQAYVEGKQIQFKIKEHKVWSDAESPMWDFLGCDYRIKPELKLRSYKNADEFLEAQKKHGLYFRRKGEEYFMFPTYVDKRAIQIISSSALRSYDELKDYYEWQDGTPCGVYEE